MAQGVCVSAVGSWRVSVYVCVTVCGRVVLVSSEYEYGLYCTDIHWETEIIL